MTRRPKTRRVGAGWPVPTLADWEDAARRVMARTVRFGECWIYTGAPARRYPQIAVLRDPETGWLRYPTEVHRVMAYAYGIVPVRGHEQVDHLCHTPRCVAPAHLRVLPAAVNLAARRDRPLHPYVATLDGAR